MEIRIGNLLEAIIHIYLRLLLRKNRYPHIKRRKRDSEISKFSPPKFVFINKFG